MSCDRPFQRRFAQHAVMRLVSRAPFSFTAPRRNASPMPTIWCVGQRARAETALVAAAVHLRFACGCAACGEHTARRCPWGHRVLCAENRHQVDLHRFCRSISGTLPVALSGVHVEDACRFSRVRSRPCVSISCDHADLVVHHASPTPARYRGAAPRRLEGIQVDQAHRLGIGFRYADVEAVGVRARDRYPAPPLCSTVLTVMMCLPRCFA